MQLKSLYLWTLLSILAFCYSCRDEKTGSDDVTRVVIVSTNDMHAQLTRFPELASFIKQKREVYPYLLVVDGGDRFSGNVYVDNALERGKPMIDLMNKVGYDLAAFGNHDFDYGQVVLKKRMEEAGFPFMCANIEATESEIGQLLGYKVIEKAGIKFCFLSLIETGSTSHIPATNPDNVKNISFPYYMEVAKANKGLKDQCDVFIGLTHLGYTSDSLLAVVVPEFDVIIGGHSHTLISEPKIINGVLVSQSGSNLRYAGVTYLDFKDKKLVNKTFEVVKLDSLKKDPEVEAMVQEFCNRPEFLEKIGVTSEGLKYKENVASLVTDAMCYATGCDFAFYNSGGVRYNSIPAGDITKETIYRIEPFNNYIVTHELTLDEMKELILNRFNGVKNPEERQIDLFVSEGRYTILKDEAGKGVDVVFVDKKGQKLVAGSHKYKIGLSNYVNSSYDFVGKGKGTNTSIYLVKAMIDFVKAKGDINYSERRTFVNKK